jgi:hypothetical protein
LNDEAMSLNEGLGMSMSVLRMLSHNLKDATRLINEVRRVEDGMERHAKMRQQKQAHLEWGSKALNQ